MVLIIVAGQVILWLALGFAETLARPSGMSPAPSMTLHITEDGTLDTVIETIERPLSKNPDYFVRDVVARAEDGLSRIGVFEATFNVDNPQEDAGLFLGWTYMVEEVRVNGAVVKAQTQVDAWGETTGFSPAAYVLSDDVLQAGDNQLLIRVNGYLTKRAPLYHVSDPASVMRAQAWGRIFATDLAGVAAAVMIFVVLLCLLIDWPREDRPWINALILLLAAWTARNLLILGFDRYVPEMVSWWLYNAVSLLLTVSLLNFALAWTKIAPRLRRLRWAAFACALGLPALLAVTGWTSWRITDLGWMLDVGLLDVLGPVVILIFGWSFARGERRETIEHLLFIVCASALWIDAVDDQLGLRVPFQDDLYLTFYFAPLCGLLLGLGMCASIAAQATRARRVVMNINETLEMRLAEREREIRGQAKSRAVVEERRRIMRDMHDGLGARLSGIILRARSGDLSYEAVPGAVQDGLDELRLIIDSLDSAGDTLAIALGAFRERAEGQFKASGIDLQWHVDETAAAAEYDAADVLQVFRILQEACSNVIRHSKADEVHVSFLRVAEDAQYPFEILISDNGRGLSGLGSTGKGLESMTARARRIGGTLRVEDTGEGVRVQLRLPPPKS